MYDWDRRQYPFTGFGDDPAAAIKFLIVRYVDDDDAAWQGGDAVLNEFQILHSNDAVTQYGGRLPVTYTTRLWFETARDLAALESVVGRQATLRYRWGLTQPVDGGTVETRAGRQYLALPDTTLVALTDKRIVKGRNPEAVATFRRSVGLGTLYDYAHYAEDE